MVTFRYLLAAPARDPKQLFIKISWLLEMMELHMGCIWRHRGKHLATPGNHLGVTWEASGSIWEACCPDNTRSQMLPKSLCCSVKNCATDRFA